MEVFWVGGPEDAVEVLAGALDGFELGNELESRGGDVEEIEGAVEGIGEGRKGGDFGVWEAGFGGVLVSGPRLSGTCRNARRRGADAGFKVVDACGFIRPNGQFCNGHHQ